MAFRKEKRNALLWLGIAYMGWFFFSRLLLGPKVLVSSSSIFCILSVSLLMALPFASIMEEEQNKKGLLIAATIGAVVFSASAWIGIAITFITRMTGLNLLGGAFYVGDDGRLWTYGHPNNAACLFLIGLFCTGYLIFTLRKKWCTISGIIMILGLWTAIAFTGSRTVMLQCSAAAAALIFVQICTSHRHPVVFRVVLATIAAAVSMLLVYKGFEWTVEGLAGSSASAETVSVAVEEEVSETRPNIAVRPLKDDLKSFTGRTRAWKGSLELIKAHPEVLITGLPDNEIMPQLNHYIGKRPYDYAHAHNAYLQVVLNLGLPGLLMSLVFTWLSLKSALTVVFAIRRKRTFADCIIALAGPVLLIATITEPFLFTEQINIPPCNFYFFLFLGYTLRLENKIVSDSKRLFAEAE